MTKGDHLLVFYEHLHRLKKLHRRGWLLRGVEENQCESVAGHMFSMAWLALYFLKDFPELDENKVLKMCLLHDIGESIVGDITPVDDVSSEEKYHKEKDAVYEIFNDSWDDGDIKQDGLYGPQMANHFKDLWQEFEEKETPEAIFVNDLDKLDLFLQALKYKHDLGESTTEFTNSALSFIKNEKLLKIALSAEGSKGFCDL